MFEIVAVSNIVAIIRQRIHEHCLILSSFGVRNGSLLSKCSHHLWLFKQKKLGNRKCDQQSGRKAITWNAPTSRKKLALLASWPDFEDSMQETNKLFSCRIAATWWSGAWTRGFGRGSRFWGVCNFGKWRSTGTRRGRFWQYWCNVTVVIFLPWSWKLGLNAWPKNLEAISTLHTGKILTKWWIDIWKQT